MMTTLIAQKSRWTITSRTFCIAFKPFQLHFTTTAISKATESQQCPARDWAKKNPQLARRCLETPPAPSLSATQIKIDDASQSPMISLENYLKYRNWNLPSKLISEEENNSETHDLIVESDKHATALLSHPLSYPLTLASQSHIFYPFMNQTQKLFAKARRSTSITTKDEKCILGIRLACIGARAEATLPTPFWQEFIFYLESSKRHYDTIFNNFSNENVEIHWGIDFVGPDVPHGIPPRLVSRDPSQPLQPQTEPQHQHMLHLQCYSGYFHDYIKTQRSNRNNKNDPNSIWDGFILFNPGIGHPHLMNHWQPTMKTIFSPSEQKYSFTKSTETRRKTKKTLSPILMTAHSNLDAQRDLQQISTMIKGINHEKDEARDFEQFSYQNNPFASRMEFVDPLDPSHILGPNHSLLTIS